MTFAWRIDKARRSKRDCFSGDGAAIEGGRWNLPGRRVVYCASTLSLAALEKFIHLGDEGRAIALSAYRVDIPKGIRAQELFLRNLPANWKAVPAPLSTMRLGSRWLSEGRTAVLRVPSVMIEIESNCLLNPLHPDFARIRVSKPQRFRFDERMWTS